MFDGRNPWNIQCIARSNRTHTPTSPNTAPAMKNGAHDWSPSHMKRPVQCTEQQESPSNITKYCTCEEKWHWWLIFLTHALSSTMRGATGATLRHHQILCLPRNSEFKIWPKNPWIASADRIGAWFEHAPTMIRPWNRHLAPAASESLPVPSWRRILYEKMQHLALRLSLKICESLHVPRKVTLQLHQILPLPRKWLSWLILYSSLLFSRIL